MKMGKFDLDKIRKEVDKIQNKCQNKEEKKRGLSTLLQFVQGRSVKAILKDGEILNGILEKYSLYEIEIATQQGAFIIWKQNIKYIQIENE